MEVITPFFCTPFDIPRSCGVRKAEILLFANGGCTRSKVYNLGFCTYKILHDNMNCLLSKAIIHNPM